MLSLSASRLAVSALPVIAGSKALNSIWPFGRAASSARVYLPTGLAVPYGILRRHSTVRQVRTIVFWRIIRACAIVGLTGALCVCNPPLTFSRNKQLRYMCERLFATLSANHFNPFITPPAGGCTGQVRTGNIADSLDREHR